MKREEITARAKFAPFRIVIQTREETNILESLAIHINSEMIRKVVKVWEIAYTDVENTLHDFLSTLRG